MSEGVKTYVCQSCSGESAAREGFKMLQILGIGFVVCRECLKGWANE